MKKHSKCMNIVFIPALGRRPLKSFDILWYFRLSYSTERFKDYPPSRHPHNSLLHGSKQMDAILKRINKQQRDTELYLVIVQWLPKLAEH